MIKPPNKLLRIKVFLIITQLAINRFCARQKGF
jgi:hypothetical protein